MIAFGPSSSRNKDKEEIVIAEHRQEALVDDRNVGEFEMRLQGVMGRDRRLDHRGVAHLRIEAAGLEGRPAGGRERRARRARPMRAMRLGQQQPRGVHVAAGDMGMNVDGAGHDDLAGDVMLDVRHAALGGATMRPFSK